MESPERRAIRSRQRKATRASGVKRAPGDLEVVRAFVSTVARGKRADELASLGRLARWLVRYGLLDPGVALVEAQRQIAFDLRRGLRGLLLANSGVEPEARALERFEEAAAGGRLGLRFEAGVPVGLAPASGCFEDGLGTIASIVLVARLDGRWPKLKLCHAPDCGNAFFDVAPNLTGKWCTTRCGERYRAAARRKRR